MFSQVPRGIRIPPFSPAAPPWASAFVLQDPRLCDEIAELGPAAAAQRGAQLGDMGTAGTDVHAEPPGDGLVHMALDQQLGDRALDACDAVERGP